MKDLSETLIETIHKMGCKATPQRITILKTLQNYRTHPSAEEIYRIVKKSHPTITLATVYKTLDSLLKAGMITQLGFYKGHMRFDTDPTPHINLICIHCGKVEDLKTELIEGITERVREKTDYRIEGGLMEFHGICGKCQRDLGEN